LTKGEKQTSLLLPQ